VITLARSVKIDRSVQVAILFLSVIAIDRGYTAFGTLGIGYIGGRFDTWFIKKTSEIWNQVLRSKNDNE